MGETGNPPAEEAVLLSRLPAGLRRLLRQTPEREWSRIRTFLVESQEEGDLAELLPEVNRAMRICPGKMIARIRAQEITGQEVDEVYRKLHEAIHAVRQAVYRVYALAGVSPRRGAPEVPTEKHSEMPATPA